MHEQLTEMFEEVAPATQADSQTPGVEVGSPAAVGQAEELGQMLRLGSAGPQVVRAQAQLNAHGAALAEDGAFGPLTHRAVVAFQGAHGLSPDGIVGPLTWAELNQTPGPGPDEADDPPEPQPEPPPPDVQPEGPAVSPLQVDANARLPVLAASPAVQASPMGPMVMSLVGAPAGAPMAAAATAPAPDAAHLAASMQALTAAVDRIIVRQEPYPGPRGAPTTISGAQDRIREDFRTQGLANHDAITDAERSWLYDFQKALGVFILIDELDAQATAGELLDGGRATIVAGALGEVGRVEARRADAEQPVPGHPNTIVPWRKGAADLDRIFGKAGAVADDGASGPGATSRLAIYDSRMPVGPDANGVNSGAPSWCGIFALAQQKYAGRTGADWPGGGAPWMANVAKIGDGQYERLDPRREFPKPGDVLLRTEGMHHGTVVGVHPNDRADPSKGFSVTSVDGNFAWASAIVIHQEDRDFWQGYFRAAPKGS